MVKETAVKSAVFEDDEFDKYFVSNDHQTIIDKYKNPEGRNPQTIEIRQLTTVSDYKNVKDVEVWKNPINTGSFWQVKQERTYREA